MWQDLQSDIEAEFGDVRFDTREGFRFFRPEDTSAAVARVNNWRKRNRTRRNETARANNGDARRKYMADYRAKNRERIRELKRAGYAAKKLKACG